MGEFIHAYKCIYLLLSIYIIYIFTTPQSYFLGIPFFPFRPPNCPFHCNYYILEDDEMEIENLLKFTYMRSKITKLLG